MLVQFIVNETGRYNVSTIKHDSPDIKFLCEYTRKIQFLIFSNNRNQIWE